MTESRANSIEDPLIHQARQGDQDAFTRLYDIYVKRIYRHIFYRVPHVVDVEDLTQEVFIRAWRSIRRYKPTERPFLAWLYTITRNLIIDYYRKKGKEHLVPLDELAAKYLEQQSSEIDATLGLEYVQQLIARLSGDQQQVLMLRFVEGFSYEDVAAAIGKSQGAVRVIQMRALRRIRDILEQER